MPGEPKPAQKRPRLPFKPPSRTTSAGPSNSAPKPKGKANPPSTKTPISTTAPKSKQSKATAKNKSTSLGKRLRAGSPTANADTASESGSESDSDESNRDRSRSLSQEPDYILAEIITTNQEEDVTSSDPKIPSKLLTRLLHHHFQNEKTKVAKDANNVVAKYVDVFVREAIARAAFEKAESDGNTGARGLGGGFLEVEDLEKMAPQLTMDF
ncbi:hypothetical protein N7475_010049 [Penicillium sp. IBT 31633x]|nr:hypothetical protein N7475_010049 [Penicillium sp. IBT 31633x]